MHSKTPSAPVLPGAITADQKKREEEEGKKKKSMITAVAKQKPNKREQEKVRDTKNLHAGKGEEQRLLLEIVGELGCHHAERPGKG